MASTRSASHSALVLRVAAKQELDRRECAASSATFIERHCTIEGAKGAVSPFRLWACQRQALVTIEANAGVIVLKARRLGMSWVVLAFALWLAIFQQGIRVLVLCKNEDDAAGLLDRIRRMRDRMQQAPASAHILQALPAPAKTRDAVTMLDVGASTIRALVGTPAAARSETAGFVILDEFAFQRGAGEIWQAVLPTMEGGGKLAVVSTGNGHEKSARIGAEFAMQYGRAVRGESGFTPLFFGWQEREDRDEAWHGHAQAALGDPTRMRIEYPATEADAFLVADADLLYPAQHLDAVETLGAELNAFGDGDRRQPAASLGIDWGVHTHMVLAQATAGGGLRLLAEHWSDRADLEVDVARCSSLLRDHAVTTLKLRYDPGAAGAKVAGTFSRLLRASCPWVTVAELKIPFSKFKVPAIQYAQLLARRTADGEAMRVLAAAQADVPELLRQMRAAEWKDADVGKTEKGDDHGADAVLTLTAELGYALYRTDVDLDRPHAAAGF